MSQAQHTEATRETNVEAAATEPVRVDLYRLPHRGLRAAMAQALVNAGTASIDPQSLAVVANEVEALAVLCKKHLEHENTFLHPAMELRTPGSSRNTADDHIGHERSIERLNGLVRQLRTRPAASRARHLLDQLYRTLALFVADNLEHMDLEERHNMRVLQAVYTDAELLALEHALVASIAPDIMLKFMRWMLPAMSAAERSEFLGQMALGAPPGVVLLVIDAAAPHLPPDEPAELLRRFSTPSSL
jgi:hypothetical protein